MRRRTPEDLARLDARLVRFWGQHGETVDYILTALGVACIAWALGYLAGQAGR